MGVRACAVDAAVRAAEGEMLTVRLTHSKERRKAERERVRDIRKEK